MGLIVNEAVGTERRYTATARNTSKAAEKAHDPFGKGEGKIAHDGQKLKVTAKYF